MALLLALAGCHKAPAPLKVCLDPNNMPFSNRAGEGLENHLAALLAHDLKRPLEIVWWAQRRGFVRNTIGQGRCDLWPGVASGVEMLDTTRPYYRAGYVFVTRADRPLAGLTLDDPRLRKLRIGVQLVGDDGDNTPPAHALARRGISGNLTGFMLYGDYRQPDPPATIVRAVADHSIDVGLVWGPLAGWHAARSPVSLRVEPVTPWLDDNRWPMAFDISVGVRKSDSALRRDVDGGLARLRPVIQKLLAQYRVTQGGN